MNNHDRAAALFISAEKVGLDAPTEARVAEAIHDAEEDIYLLIESELAQYGMTEASAAVGRMHARRHSED